MDLWVRHEDRREDEEEFAICYTIETRDDDSCDAEADE